MIGNRLINWFIFGTIAGTLLACFFYWIEKALEIKLYTFLLNIDFLPLPDSIIYSVPVQFVLHLFISVILIAIIDILYERFSHPFLLSVIINTIMSFTFFPLYQMAISKPFFPPFFFPFALWIIGHILYALLIGTLFHIYIKKGVLIDQHPSLNLGSFIIPSYKASTASTKNRSVLSTPSVLNSTM
jgi:hypothetical protein